MGTLISMLMLSTSAEAQPIIPADPTLKPGAPVDPNRPLAQELVASASPALSVTAVGSLLIDSPDGKLPPLDPSISLLLSGADRVPAGPNVTVGTLAGPVFDLSSVRAFPYPWEAAPTAWDPTPYPYKRFPVVRAGPLAAPWLKAARFDALMLASDHALDWGIEGMRATQSALDSVGIARSGTGETASLAAHANYVEQEAGGGRVALVATATMFRPTSNALDQEGAAPGRPGVHGIELDPTFHVSAPQLATLRTVACRYSYPADPSLCPPSTGPVNLFNNSFDAASDPTRAGTVDYKVNESDAAVFLHGIREGKENADLLVAAIYASQADDARTDVARAPTFLSTLARSAIAAGADVVTVTGSPGLGPIEIYAPPAASGRPRPIFYGLGSFAWTEGLAPDVPSHGGNVGLIARTTIAGGTLTVDIFAVDLSGIGGGPGGWPRLAAKDKALAALMKLQQLSRPYGTNIAMVNYGRTAQGRITIRFGSPNKEGAAK